MNNTLKTLLIASGLFFVSCGTTQYCKKSKNYFKKVDFNKPFDIESTYCVKRIVVDNKEGCEIMLNVFDRIAGKPVEKGTAFFSDSLKLVIANGKAQGVIPSGVYDLGILTNGEYSSHFGIGDLDLNQYGFLEINCFVGGILQF